MSYQPLTYRKQGGDEFVVASSGQITVESGGELEIESGGTIDVESGGYLKLAGTAITATAAEVNSACDRSVVTASTAAAAAFGGVLMVSSTGSAGTGVYKLTKPTAAGQVMDVICKTSTGVGKH